MPAIAPKNRPEAPAPEKFRRYAKGDRLQVE
jgi:hypothetical protein